MKEPDEWSSSFQRWLPAIIGVFLSLLLVTYVYIGVYNFWSLALQLFVVVFAFGMQLEYEWKKGVLS